MAQKWVHTSKQSLTSNWLPTALARHSPACAALKPSSHRPSSPSLGWQQWHHALPRRGKLLTSCLPFIPTSSQRCGKWRKSHLCWLEEGEHGSSSEMLNCFYSSHPLVIPCPGRTLPAPCTLLDGLLSACPGTSASTGGVSRFLLLWVTTWNA